MSGFLVVLNGPNLNLLGEREPAVYGRGTLAEVEQLCADTAASFGLEARCRQSNHEGELVELVQQWRTDAAGFVVNAGAWTHTSIALRDALAMVHGPLMEVHISNVHKREAFRHHSYISPVASSIIIGAGVHGYKLAVQQLAHLLGK